MSAACPSPVPAHLKRKLDSKLELESDFMISCNRLGSSGEDGRGSVGRSSWPPFSPVGLETVKCVCMCACVRTRACKRGTISSCTYA